MEFTTRFGLHSQATRLREERTPAGRGALPACHRPWAEAPSGGLRPPAPHRGNALFQCVLFPRTARRRPQAPGTAPGERALPYATIPAPGEDGDSALGSSLFARRYWGNPGEFLFLRLVICLNSAGCLV